MPRHTYWVIVTGTDATAFRAREAEDLLPTLKQLQRTQPDAVLKWFERGKLWESPEQALADLRRPRVRTRGAAWRPGGSHVDPRARFKVPRDEKRRRFKQRQRREGSQSATAVSRPKTKNRTK